MDEIEILKKQLTKEKMPRPTSSSDNKNSQSKIVQKRKLVEIDLPTEPIIAEIEPNKVEKGGNLWNPPGNADELRQSYQNAIEIMRRKENQSLFEMAMENPKKKLEPTLFTYYDILMEKQNKE